MTARVDRFNTSWTSRESLRRSSSSTCSTICGSSSSSRSRCRLISDRSASDGSRSSASIEARISSIVLVRPVAFGGHPFQHLVPHHHPSLVCVLRAPGCRPCRGVRQCGGVGRAGVSASRSRKLHTISVCVCNDPHPEGAEPVVELDVAGRPQVGQHRPARRVRRRGTQRLDARPRRRPVARHSATRSRWQAVRTIDVTFAAARAEHERPAPTIRSGRRRRSSPEPDHPAGARSP